MNSKRTLVSGAIALCCAGISSGAYAALPVNALLKIDSGVGSCVLGGTYPDNCTYGLTDVASGSWFSMDTNKNGTAEENERTPVTSIAGIALGVIQPASGAHSGGINGAENPGIDIWEFFGHTGMHQSTIAVTISGGDDGAVGTGGVDGIATLDLSGWNVTWSGIASIPMGGDAVNFGTTGVPGDPDSGKAVLTCDTNCSDGEGFVLTYKATVPKADASNFGGVSYLTQFEGTISAPVPLSVTVGDTIARGTDALSIGSIDERVTMAELVGEGIPDDSGYTFSGGLYDFSVTNVGLTTQVVLPLTAPIPAGAVYRKYIDSGGGAAWTTFTPDADNLIASAALSAGNCPIPGHVDYNHGVPLLVEGHECVQLTIQDDDPFFDSNPAANTIDDPGGIGVGVGNSTTNYISGTSGCSISNTPVNPIHKADWWLLAGFMAWLGFKVTRKQRS